MMELKKFEAPTLAQALQVVKKELGPDAIIISTRNNKSGFGILGGSSVEVTAAVSQEALERKVSAESRMTEQQIRSMQNKPSRRVSQAYEVLSGATIEKKLARARAAFSDNGQDSIAQRLASQTVGHRTNFLNDEESPKSTASLQKQIADARGRGLAALFPNENNRHAQSSLSQKAPDMLSAQRNSAPLTQRRYVDITDDDNPAEQASMHSRDQARISNPVRHTQPKANMAMPSSVPHAAQQLLPRVLAGIIESGIDEELVRELGDELKVIMIREQIVREDILRMQLARVLMSRLRVAKPLSERLRSPATPRLISFVGPTGVGKTTTIAKIAAELVINQNRPVVLATTDTYKIAAIEQLQTYANILRIPLEVCPTAESLENLAQSVSGDQVVLVDTAGYGPKDEKKIGELRDLLSTVRTEIHLCLTAMTRDRDLAQLVRRFKEFEPQYLVMTKLDETSSFGGIFNVSVRNHLPLSYLTMGQRVPEDMEVATKERIADLILNISGGVF